MVTETFLLESSIKDKNIICYFELMKIREITNCLEQIAPLHYQESYDNQAHHW